MQSSSSFNEQPANIHTDGSLSNAQTASSNPFNWVVFAYHSCLYHIRLLISRIMQSSSSFNEQPAIVHTDGSLLNAQTASSNLFNWVVFAYHSCLYHIRPPLISRIMQSSSSFNEQPANIHTDGSLSNAQTASSNPFNWVVFAYHSCLYHIRLLISRIMQSSSSFNEQPAIVHTDGSLLNAQTASSNLFNWVVFAYHSCLYHIRPPLISRIMQSSSSFNEQPANIHTDGSLLNAQTGFNEQPAIIHTDGSLLNAQTVSSGAGFGVFFGEGDARNIAAPLCKYDVNYRALSNDCQRPELAGIRQGLRYIAECPMTQMYILKTDSQDSIARILGRVSKRNRNADLVRDCMRLYHQIRRKYMAKSWDFTIQYVERDKNGAADSLAWKGAWQDMAILGRRMV